MADEQASHPGLPSNKPSTPPSGLDRAEAGLHSAAGKLDAVAAVGKDPIGALISAFSPPDPKAPKPPPPPPPPTRPTAKAAQALKDIASVAGDIGTIAGILSDPAAALEHAVVGKAAAALDDKLAEWTNPISALLPDFPAATLLAPALGLPHAHTAHPPSGPPPLPPTPLPALGPVMLGTCVSVLINSLPAARCGDIGFSPTCCALPPGMYSIKTGSSKVFIGGARAARALIDITSHCKPADRDSKPPKLSMLQKIGKVAGAVAKYGGIAAHIASIVDQEEEAEVVAKEDAAEGAAMSLAAGMAAAQMAADLAAEALSKLMGKDVPIVPPGSLGMIMMGSPTVLIGGLPLPSSQEIAAALMKCVKGLKLPKRGKRPPPEAASHCTGQNPINYITGAAFHDFVDAEVGGPLVFRWDRRYDSRWHRTDGPLGTGFRHGYQRCLRLTVDGIDYVDHHDNVVSFPAFAPGQTSAARDGLLLRKADDLGRYAVEEPGKPGMTFQFDGTRAEARLRTLGHDQGRLEFTYDSAGVLKQISDADGMLIKAESDSAGRITRLVLQKHPTRRPETLVTYRYDAAGHMVTARDALNQSTAHEYDRAGRMTRFVDRRGYATYNEYDAQGRCTREYNEDGLYDGRVEYFPGGGCTVVTYADGAATVNLFDEAGNPTEVIRPSGGKTKWTRAEDGRALEEVDPNGNVTRFLYDRLGGHTARVNPLGYVLPRSDVDPNPRNPLAYTLPATPLAWLHGAILEPDEIQPPTRDDPVLVDFPAGTVNSILKLTLRREGDPRATLGEPRRLYDALNRLVEEVDADGLVRRWTYDPNGNVLSYQDREGAVHRTVYKSWNLVGERVSPLNAVTRYDYSIRAEITRVEDPGGAVLEYKYDGWDRLTEVRRHGRVMERYRYDDADNLLEKSDGDNRPLLKFEVLPGNLHGVRELASGERQTFEYDGKGRITRAATDTLDATFAWAPDGTLLKDQRDGTGLERERSGYRTVTTYFGTFRVTHDRTEPTRCKITTPTGAVQRVRWSTGGLVAAELSNGTTELVHYDDAGRCREKIGLGRARDRIRWQERYVYSAEGRLHLAETLDASTRYQYDLSGRLRQEILPGGVVREFVFDVADNLVAQPGLTGVTFQEGNRLATANGERFEYNTRNAIGARSSPGRDVRYVYDSLDRLVGCEVNGERWTGEYDPLCRLVRSTWRGRTTSLFWDDWRLAAEERPDGAVRLYVYPDEAAFVPLLFVEYAGRDADPESGRLFFVFTNHLGVPVRVEDERAEVVWRARIDPFGLAHVAADSTLELNLRFPGHYFVPETGLHANRFRAYDPVLGRYLQSDPYGLAGGVNHYAYCPNPLTTVDLDGLEHKGNTGPGGGAPTAAGPAQQATGGSPTTTGQSIQDRAQALKARNGGRNRVTLPDRQVDLDGAPHHDKTTGQDIKTPHTCDPRPPFKPGTPGEGRSPGFERTPRPTTHEDLDAVDAFLTQQGK